MNPKEKAEDLVLIYLCNKWFNKYVSKQCALIAVDEILNSRKKHLVQSIKFYQYWLEVKKEIEKL